MQGDRLSDEANKHDDANAVTGGGVIRSDEAHESFESQTTPVAGLLASRDMRDDPSQVLGRQCPQAIDKLERLDDTVFEAIAGRPGALEQLQALWPEVLAEVGPSLVEESRAQYLRHALHVWRECVEGDQIRNPALAITSMEVVYLLFNS